MQESREEEESWDPYNQINSLHSQLFDIFLLSTSIRCDIVRLEIEG